MPDIFSGPTVTIPHLCSFVVPTIVNQGFLLAAFLFAAAYLVSRLEGR